MRKNIKLILLAAAVVIVITGLAVYKSTPLSAATSVIAPKTAELSFTEQGVVQAQRQIEVFAVVSGEISQVGVVEGQHVNEGDILCRIDDSSAYETSGRQINVQNIQVSQSEADLEQARENASKVESLYNAGALSAQDLIDAENAIKDSENTLQINQQQLNGSIEQRSRGISDTTVRSPVSGVVSKLNIKDTNVVNVQTPIAVITAESDCVVEVYVSVKDIDAVAPGKKVSLTLEGRYANTEITGTVTAVGDHAEAKTSALGVEERKVKVTVAPDDPDELKDGYDVDVTFSYYHEDDKLTVPKSAVFKENDEDTVFIVKNGRAQGVQVVKGVELRTEYVIESGLNPGDIVINDSNIAGLKDGVRIK